jgi:hypothetical protein
VQAGKLSASKAQQPAIETALMRLGAISTKGRQAAE